MLQGRVHYSRGVEHRKIGSLNVSLAGLGCNNFGWRVGKDATREVVDAALDAGINFFDTADFYGAGQSEEYLGEVIGDCRNRIVLATKFGLSMGEGLAGASPTYVKQACEASLRRLRTDHIDLYQLHRPDEATPIADTLGALDDLVKEGKVREIGCSNFSVQQLREAAAAVGAGAAKFVSVQNNYSLFHREPEQGVLEECARLEVGFLPYFPLANGMLSGKYRKGQPLPESSRAKDGFGPSMFTEANLEKVESLLSFAEQRGHSLLELGVSWLASRGVVSSVIAGAKSVAQVKENAAATGWEMSAAELAEIDAILA